MIPVLAFHPPVIAHRGVSSLAPENTLAALKEVRGSGAAWVEFDVKLSMDGVPILMHDNTLERTTDGEGYVADTTWDNIKKLDAGNKFDPKFDGEHVPRLTEALQLALDHGLMVNVELKPCPGRSLVTTMVVLIEMSKVWPEKAPLPLIASFDPESLMIAAQFQPLWPRSLLMDKWYEDWESLAEKMGVATLAMREDLLTCDRVQEMAKAPWPLIAYTVNDPLRARELLRWGVSAVVTDDPRKMIESL